METVNCGLPNLIIHFDELVVQSATHQEHLEQLGLLLQ